MEIFMMTGNANADGSHIVEAELILDFILLFRERNNDDNTPETENLPRWRVIQDNGGFDLFGDEDFAVIKEALTKRFQNLSAIPIRESVIINLRHFS
jgi:hypothetical protein